ncbi:MAG: TetR/AcrR family transcriptional regulator [Deltaproteobacteria bacterium]|nr:TetR/AcrR family transcriptional regulator [Deltaproteobacteria bacterium]
MNGPIKSERKDRRRERVRKEILRAAAEVFTSKGFHEATIQEIARVADFSAGALYNYFDNKETLFCDLIADVQESLQQRLNLPDPALPLADQLRHVVSTLFAFAEEYRNHFRLVALLHMGGGLALGRNATKEFAAGPLEFSRFICTTIERAIAAGEARDQALASADTFIQGVIQGFTFRWFHEPGGKRLTDQTETVVQLIMHGIARPPAAAAAAKRRPTGSARKRE